VKGGAAAYGRSTFMGAFDEQWWAHHWWLIFPIFGFGIAFFSIWLQHRRHHSWMQLMNTYAAQGKEPPPGVLNAANTWQANAWQGGYGCYGRRVGSYFDGRRAIIFGAIAAGFAFAYYNNPSHNEAFGTVAAIMGALAIGFLLISLLRPRPNDMPQKPDEK
jgi:hypothetical protein